MAVYFIQEENNGNIKIGSSNDPYKRLGSLQTGNSKKLKLIKIIKGGKEVESRLHHKFRKDKKTGEWFFPSEELLKFINEKSNNFIINDRTSLSICDFLWKVIIIMFALTIALIVGSSIAPPPYGGFWGLIIFGFFLVFFGLGWR